MRQIVYEYRLRTPAYLTKRKNGNVEELRHFCLPMFVWENTEEALSRVC
jgi:hypothetical protein